uniref:BTB domain-containing protein n=1 Tax=Heterorhabditis bacteriophora TaxID=37862 RepID=A0A1I7WXU6_HETBA
MDEVLNVRVTGITFRAHKWTVCDAIFFAAPFGVLSSSNCSRICMQIVKSARRDLIPVFWRGLTSLRRVMLSDSGGF